MKKYLAIVICTIFALISCDFTDNFGYPAKVHLGKEGGTTFITGDAGFYHVAIDDYDGDGKEASWNQTADDTITVSYQWLTIHAIPREYKIYLTAEPNTTGKSRKLYIYAWVDDRSADIKVTQ